MNQDELDFGYLLYMSNQMHSGLPPMAPAAEKEGNHAVIWPEHRAHYSTNVLLPVYKTLNSLSLEYINEMLIEYKHIDSES